MTVAARQYSLRSTDTVWDYAAWKELPDDGNRYEIIDGVLYMTTAPSNFHQYIVGNLTGLVGWPFQQTGAGFWFTAPIGLLIPGCDPVQPDFLLVRAERRTIIANRRIRGVPDLIVEVLSPGNRAQDTVVKRAAYARASLPEYWIVRPDTRDILVYTAPEPAASDFSAVQRFASDTVLTSPTIAGMTLDVAALFAGAPDTTL